jgi:hypothetical protein
MFEDEIIVALLVTVFALCLHYYIGVIDLWYMPAVEIGIALIFYELSKGMVKSYKIFEHHNKSIQKARQEEINLITELNTSKNQNIIIGQITPKAKETKETKETKSITFDKNKEVRHFRNDEKILDDIEITVGTHETMSDTTMSDTNEVMSLEEEFNIITK